MTHTPPKVDRVCAASLTALSQTALEAVLRPLAAATGQPMRAVVTWGGQVGQSRRANIEIRDSMGREVSGQFAALVWVSSTPGGAPDGTQVLTVADGSLVRELESGRVLLVATNARAEIQIDVEGAAGSRWIGVVPLGGLYGSAEVWA